MADLIFIIIMIVAVLIGRKMGFLKGLVNLVCVALSALGGYLLYPYVTAFLVKTPLFDTICTPVSKYILDNYLKGTPVEDLNLLLTKYGAANMEDLFLKMAQGITTVIINIISIIVVFLAIRFILNLVKGITSLITKLPVISSLDKLLGMIMSAFSTLLIIYVVVAVMMIPPCNSSEISRKMCEYIDNSVITKQVMDYNIFINYESLATMGEI